MDILTERLHNQLLIDSWMKTPYEVVKHMVCMQAQDWGQSKRAIASRVAWWCRVKDIESAYNEWKIVRTRTQRWTIHAVATEDVPMMLQLCATKTRSGFKKRREYLNMSDETAERALDVFKSVLKWWNKLTRKEMLKALEEGWIKIESGWWYHLLCYAGSLWLIVMGPMKDGEQAFVLLDERLEKANTGKDRQIKSVIEPQVTSKQLETIKELTLRYFASHGPATIADFARWSGLGMTQIKQGIIKCGHDLEEAGGLLRFARNDVESQIQKHSRIAVQRHSNFLAGFDEFLLGYKDRTATLEFDHHVLVDTSRNGIFKPTVMIDGKTIGIWSCDLKKKDCVLQLQWFGKLSKSDYKILEKGTEAYGKYIEKKLNLDIV